MKNTTIKILLVEDNKDDVRFINRFISTRSKLNFTTTTVGTKEDYERALSNNTFDIVLCDHSLQDFNSVEALKIARLTNPFLPFIIVSGAASEEFVINLFEQGADNYVMKDNLKRLPSAITKAIEIKRQLCAIAASCLHNPHPA